MPVLSGAPDTVEWLGSPETAALFGAAVAESSLSPRLVAAKKMPPAAMTASPARAEVFMNQRSRRGLAVTREPTPEPMV